MTAPLFSIAPITPRLGKAKLIDLHNEASAMGFLDPITSDQIDRILTVPELVKEITAARRDFWNKESVVPKPPPAPARAARWPVVNITAAECNAWLATLPRMEPEWPPQPRNP